MTWIIACLLLCSCRKTDVSVPLGYTAPIYPDYTDVTIPYNIAPLDFHITDPALARAMVEVKGATHTLRVKAHKGDVTFPLKKWHRLLENEKGNILTVSIRNQSATISNPPSSVSNLQSSTDFSLIVSPDPIPPCLSYRLVQPGYEVYGKMGIYERDLTSFNEHPLIENTQFAGCVNCHSYNQGDPASMSLHIRGNHGATLIRSQGSIEAFETRTDSTLGFCVYPYWHPSGDYIAFSTNNTRQGFHVGQDKLIEVFDLASDVQVYDVRSGELIIPRHLRADSVWETFPAFSPDGRTLYYCAATARPIPAETTDIRYNLCRVPFDPDTGIIGTDIDTLVMAEPEGKSVSFPRPSYDGRYLMYTLSDYGQFSIWHHEADLWLLDLQTAECRLLVEVNSTDTESYHQWSPNSRWFVFSSRRDDGLHTRPYFAHMDADGHIGRPFMLPQRHPARFYASRMHSFNVPEFTMRPTHFPTRRAAQLIRSPHRTKMKLSSNKE